MTPFHVLLSATKTKTRLAARLIVGILPASFTLHFGQIFQDCLGLLSICRWTKEWKDLARLCLTHWMVGSMCWWGLPRWRSDMFTLVDQILHTNDWETRRDTLHNATNRMMEYQRLEQTSLLELWLWKLTLQTSASEKGSKGSKGTLRLLCGANFFIPKVVSFLGKLSLLVPPDADVEIDWDLEVSIVESLPFRIDFAVPYESNLLYRVPFCESFYFLSLSFFSCDWKVDPLPFRILLANVWTNR